MLTTMDADSLACACGILGLYVAEQKKGTSNFFYFFYFSYILRPFNSEDAEGSDDEGSSWYAKLYNHLRDFQKSRAPFSFKQKSEPIENHLFDSNQFSQNFIWRN